MGFVGMIATWPTILEVWRETQDFWREGGLMKEEGEETPSTG